MFLISGLMKKRLIISVILILITFSSGKTPGRVEYALLDLRFSINRAIGSDKPPADTAVILVTAQSEQRLNAVYGSGWRQWYPSMISTLNSAGASAIVWDATFVASEPKYDQQLVESFKTIPVITVENNEEKNTALLREAMTGIGWKQLTIVSGIPRRILTGTSMPPLGEVVANYLLHSEDDINWLDYSINPVNIPTYDLADVLLASDNRLGDERMTPISVFTDKIVFIGLNLPGRDRYPIPGSGGSLVPGVYSQVVSLWTHLNPRQIWRVEGVTAQFIALIFGLSILLTGTARIHRIRITGVSISIVMAFLIPLVFFTIKLIWLPYALILLQTASSLVLVTFIRRLSLARNYRTSLGFDPRLLEKYAREIQTDAKGVERTAVVLCADVRNYTKFVSNNPGDIVQKVMTEYMAAMESVVNDHGGYINKYVGDEIVAVFGFPLDEKNVQHRAVAAARDMLVRIGELRENWISDGVPALDGIGIGVDSGDLCFTNLGGNQRIQFDIIGNAINGASRLQTLTKEYGTPLVVSEEVVEGQDVYSVDSDASGERFYYIGEVAIRGQGERKLFGIR